MRRKPAGEVNMTSIPELEQRLADARQRLDRAMKALAPKHHGGEMEEYWAAHSELLRVERELASASGEEFAVPLDFPVRWDIGAPLPHLIVSDTRALLSFYLRETDPNWDGSYVTLKDPSDGSVESLALVEFEHCISAKLGGPNDEVFEGHPLSGRGLEPYSAQVVKNSRWIQELESINSVHRMYNPDLWRDSNHYVFWFHDSTFECVARSYKVETHRESMTEMLARMAQRALA